MPKFLQLSMFVMSLNITQLILFNGGIAFQNYLTHIILTTISISLLFCKISPSRIIYGNKRTQHTQIKLIILSLSYLSLITGISVINYASTFNSELGVFNSFREPVWYLPTTYDLSKSVNGFIYLFSTILYCIYFYLLTIKFSIKGSDSKLIFEFLKTLLIFLGIIVGLTGLIDRFFPGSNIFLPNRQTLVNDNHGFGFYGYRTNAQTLINLVCPLVFCGQYSRLVKITLAIFFTGISIINYSKVGLIIYTLIMAAIFFQGIFGVTKKIKSLIFMTSLVVLLVNSILVIMQLHPYKYSWKNYDGSIHTIELEYDFKEIMDKVNFLEVYADNDSIYSIIYDNKANLTQLRCQNGANYKYVDLNDENLNLSKLIVNINLREGTGWVKRNGQNKINFLHSIENPTISYISWLQKPSIRPCKVVVFNGNVSNEIYSNKHPFLSILKLEYQSRIKLIKQSFIMLKDKPIFGYGFNSYSSAVLAYRNVGEEWPAWAHNDILQIVVEIGILGSFIFILINIFIIWNFFKGKYDIGIKISILGFLIMATHDFPFQIFGLVIALLTVLFIALFEIAKPTHHQLN